MDDRKLWIGAYYLAAYASTEQHVKDLAQCGIEVVMNMRNDRAALDLLDKHGVKAVVSGLVPGWFGGDGSNAGTMAQKNPLEAYELGAQRFEDHPAIIGVDAGDEPSSVDFEHYGRVIDAIKAGFPGKLAYLNIYPRYALKGSNTAQEIATQLGTADYRAYIDRYVRYVNTHYICFDYYLYSASLSGLYESMAAVSEACRKNGREMWTVLQVNSHQSDVFVSEDQLRFQAGCALAFGARAIIWACYSPGWWHNNVLDREGNKTQQYDKLKNVNAQLHRIGETYMKYRHQETYFVGGFTQGELKKTGKTALEALDTDCFTKLHAHGTKLLVGRMTGDGEEALVIVAADDPYAQTIETYRVCFESQHDICALDEDGEKRIVRNEDGIYELGLHTCQMILLIAR